MRWLGALRSPTRGAKCEGWSPSLVAPYCAIPWDYLSDTPLPSDTKLLLMKKKLNKYFWKITNFTRNFSGKSLSFPEIVRVQIPAKITKNNSRGIIFVIISCQRVLRAMGFGVSTWPIGCDTPSPFSERFPLAEHAKWRCDTPPPLKGGISAIPARYPLKARQMGAIPPSAILSRKGIARYGGVSRIGPLRAHLRDPGFLKPFSTSESKPSFQQPGVSDTPSQGGPFPKHQNLLFWDLSLFFWNLD